MLTMLAFKSFSLQTLACCYGNFHALYARLPGLPYIS